MSLENLIQENTSALKALTAKLEALLGTTDGEEREEAYLVDPSGEVPTTVVFKKKSKSENDREATTAPVSTLPPVSYTAVRNLILELSAAHREEIKSILATEGLKKLSDLLIDVSNMEKGVTNQGKLDNISASLIALS